MKKFLPFAGCLLILFVSVAATGGSLQTAIGIAGVLALVIPFGLKLVPAAGHYMVAICMIASLVIAAVSLLLSGEVDVEKLKAADLPTLIAFFLAVEGLSQRLYSILLQSPKTENAVT